MIEDRDIPGADPAQVIEQYEPYLQKLANRYIPALAQTGAVGMDDLVQVGRIAITEAQRKYIPENGSFMNCLFYYARNAMRTALGFNNQTGEAPAALVYLDAPLSAESETTLAETIEDPAAVPMDEPILEDENRRETSEQIRAALERMRSDKQRAAVSLVWLEGKTRQAAADEMHMKEGAFYSLEKAGRSTLRRDYQLRKHAESMPFVHITLSRFNTTWTSATEYLALWRLDNLRQISPGQPEHISKAEQIRAVWNREHE